MDHASQMAAARELRASFSGQPSTGSRRPVGPSGGHNLYDFSAAPHYQQPALGRHAMSHPQNATGAGASASVGVSGSSSQAVTPQSRPAVSRNTKQTINVAHHHDNSGTVSANPSRAIPPHLRGPVGQPPEQLAGSPQFIPPHLRTPAGSSTQQPTGTGGSGEGQNSGAKFQTGNSQATSNNQTPDTSRAFANGLGGLQNSRFADDTQPTQSTAPTQTATLKGTETAKQIVSADNNHNPPVIGHSTGRHIRFSAQDAPSPHLRQSARDPTQQSGGADTVGGAQGASVNFNFHTGDTQADVFNFQTDKSQPTAECLQGLQDSQFAKGAQPPTSSALWVTNAIAPRASSAANAGSHAPVDHLPDTAGSQTVRRHGGLENSRFALNSRLGQSMPLSATRLPTPSIATNSYDNHFGGMASGANSRDSQQRHVSKHTTLPVAAKEAPTFVPTTTRPVMAPSTARPGLMTPEPDKRDGLSADVEMMDAGRDSVVVNATKNAYDGILQSRWAPRAVPDTKALQANVPGYRRPEPTWRLARLAHPTPTPARFDALREHEPLESATFQSLGPATAKHSHAKQPENVKKSVFGGLASSRFA